MYKYKEFKSGHIRLWEADSDEELFEGRNSHCHKECEIYFLIDGEAELIVEGQAFLLAPDSFLFMPANSFHQWKLPAGKVNRRRIIHFMPEAMSKTEKIYFMDLFKEPLHFLSSSLYNLDFYYQSIIECEDMEETLQKIAVKHRFISLLTQVKFLKSKHAAKPVILDERIQRMLVYISENLHEKFTLDKIAEKFALSKNLLNNHFSNAVGTTIMKYITIKRLEFARQKIIDGIPVGEASYLAGFGDYTTFYRAYKSYYGTSPSE